MFRKNIFLKQKPNLHKTDNMPKISIFTADNKILYIAKNWIFFPLLFAVIFSLPLYINIIAYKQNIYFPYVNTILALIAVFTFININKRFRYLFGFFVAILWFYWVGLSFRFTEVPYFFFISAIFVAIVYGFVFWVALFFQNPIFRALTLSLLSYLVILGFDWFVPDILFAFSVFKVDKISFAIIVFTIAIISFKPLKFFRFFAIFLFAIVIDFNTREVTLPSTKILLTQTDISQHEKWQQNNFNAIINYNLNLIQNAINNGYDIVVLPETAIPVVLNIDIHRNIRQQLLHMSKNIDIVVGAQRKDKFKYYNSTFIFSNGKYTFADKVFLAPFGEYNPMPDFALDVFYKISGVRYAGFDKSSAKPKNIVAGNLIFRNAICYEATTKMAYEDDPKYMMLISNNAWFKPSIEPILQMTLIKYYSRLHKTIVFLSANGSKSGIITPNISLNFYAKAN